MPLTRKTRIREQTRSGCLRLRTSLLLLHLISQSFDRETYLPEQVVTSLLEELGIHYLLEREGLHACKLWSDVLSLGELQCLACVRMLYQLAETSAGPTTETADPGIGTRTRTGTETGGVSRAGQTLSDGCCCRWAILDECTSAMDAAVETNFFRFAAAQGISVESFSQRKSAAVTESEAPEEQRRGTRLLKLGTGALGWKLE